MPALYRHVCTVQTHVAAVGPVNCVQLTSQCIVRVAPSAALVSN
jgi:hypothetical protein